MQDQGLQKAEVADQVACELMCELTFSASEDSVRTIMGIRKYNARYNSLNCPVRKKCDEVGS